MTLNEVKHIIGGHFKKLVGLTQLKSRIEEKFIAAYRERGEGESGFFAPMFIEGAPGQGKSKLLRVIGGIARDVLGVEALYFADGEETGTALTFAEKVLVPKFNSQKAWLIIDEFTKAKRPVQNIVRSLINPDVQRSPVYRRVAHDLEICAHPMLNTFILATNEVDKVDPALISRCEHSKLPLYTAEELELILGDGLKDSSVKFHENTLHVFADSLRGTARFAVNMINSIRSRCDATGKQSINREDANVILANLELYPCGLYASEVKTLLHLEKGAMQLKELADANVIASREQNEGEKFLRYRRFVKIDGKRHLTADGQAYINDLRKHKFALPVLK